MTPLKLDFVWKSFININYISIILDKLKLHLQLLAYYVKYIYINAGQVNFYKSTCQMHKIYAIY